MTKAPLIAASAERLRANRLKLAEEDRSNEQIDRIDEQILFLLQERLRLARLHRQLRVTRGGLRLQLSDEIDLARRYASALGRRFGGAIAAALIQLGREDD